MSQNRTVLLAFSLLFSIVFAQAQYQWPGVYEIVNNLCAEWKFEYREMNGLRMAENTMNAVRKGNVVFFENKTYLLKHEGTIIERGFWDYNRLRDRVELKAELAGPLKAIITPLSPDRLVMVPISQNGNSHKVYDRLRYYYRKL